MVREIDRELLVIETARELLVTEIARENMRETTKCPDKSRLKLSRAASNKESGTLQLSVHKMQFS